MPLKEDQSVAGTFADQLIKEEVVIQDRMWGDANERADSTRCQLLAAAAAQVNAIFFSRVTMAPPCMTAVRPAGAVRLPPRENAFASAITHRLLTINCPPTSHGIDLNF